MRKMLFIVGIGSILFLSACSSNKYDEAIDEVIALEDKALHEPGVQEHTIIKKLKRENTKVKVFDDGKYIQIFYNIRKNDEIDNVYKKNGDHYERVVEDMDEKDPDYTENIDE